uniref:Uncharacterized protein n=1 Tax=Ditylenchus dipsaci TaxID=166011 RepID=A0A915EAG2_9BILA
MTGDGPSYSFSTPFLNRFHAFNVSSEPSTSDQTATPLTTGRMKRKLDRGDEQFGDIPVPQPKRALYEDRMSNKLWNFHIGDTSGEAYGASTQLPAIEEVDSDCVDPIVEEPACNMSDEPPAMTADGIVLSNGLRKFLKSCRERDGDFLFKPSKTGKELVLYQSPISQNIVSPDIRDRIEEIQNWDEEELDDDEDRCKQIVSFPDSKKDPGTSHPFFFKQMPQQDHGLLSRLQRVAL